MKQSRISFFPAFLIGIIWLVGTTSLFFQSIRLDESQSLWVATKSVPVILSEIAHDVHVPLYEILLHFWIKLFGINIAVTRLMSSLFFLLTLPALYTLAKEASNKKVAYLTVVLFSLSPFISWYSSEARMYTLFTLIATLNSLFFLRFVRSKVRLGTLGLFVTTLLGFFTHYFFFLLTFAQAVYLVSQLIVTTHEDKEEPFHRERVAGQNTLVKIFFLLSFLSFILFTPWLVYFIHSGLAQNTSPLIPKPTSYTVLQTFLAFFVGSQTQYLQGAVISVWPIFILILFFVFTKRQERVKGENLDYFFLITFLPVLLTFIVSFVRSVFLARYLIFVTPTLFFLVSWTLLNNPKVLSRILITLLLTIMVGLFIYQNAFAASPQREDYDKVATYLETHAKPQDIIAVSAPFTIYPLEYTYQGPDRIVTIPYWDQFKQGPIPAFSENNLKVQIAQYKKTYARIFIVLSYDQGYQKKIEDYFDKHYQRLALKEFPQGIEVREYILRYDVPKELLK